MVKIKVTVKVEPLRHEGAKKKEHEFGKNVLKVSKLEALNNKGLLALKDISFEIKEGEILGIAGVEGNGQSELVEVLTGLRKAKKGKIILYDKDITNDSPREIKEEKRY